jgi:hypothetical protein
MTLQPSGVEEFATADMDGTWRVLLPPVAASLGHTITVFSTSGDNATLSNVAFGDVFLCGGQSNMVFAVPAMTNASAEIAAADCYPHIRIFTVGIGTQSAVPLRDLQTVREPWKVASSRTISEDVTPGHTMFGTFSAVCWVFGRKLSDALTRAGQASADGGPIPLGLISNNWGGTKIEQWMPADAIAPCTPAHAGGTEDAASRHALPGAGAAGALAGRAIPGDWSGDHSAVLDGWQGAPPGRLFLGSAADSLPLGSAADSHLYNAMIMPYAEGPMQLSGAIWYQVRAVPSAPLFSSCEFPPGHPKSIPLYNAASYFFFFFSSPRAHSVLRPPPPIRPRKQLVRPHSLTHRPARRANLCELRTNSPCSAPNRMHGRQTSSHHHLASVIPASEQVA